MDKIKIFLFSFGILAQILCIFGCTSPPSKDRDIEGRMVYFEALSETEKRTLREHVVRGVKEGMRRYRLSPGDVLEVMYHISSTPESDQYKLAVSDEIEIEFYYHPEMNRTALVRPDGKITLPRKGDIMAAGLPPVELASVISNKFIDIFAQPKVTIHVKKFSSEIADLKIAVTNSPRGQAKAFAVTPDGYMYLPLLPGIKAARRTVDELRYEINKKYQVKFRNVEVSVLLESIAGNRVFVFEEVRRPGVINMTKPLMVLQAIAMAGGVLPTGSLENVKILYWDHCNIPHLRTLNLLNVMLKMKIHEDFLLPASAIIFVPMTKISKLDKWVDQYIRQLFLWQGESLSIDNALFDKPFFHESRDGVIK